jgi:hypothetical protein
MIILNLLQAQAKLRMMKQKDSGKSEPYWSNLWGKPREYQNSGMRNSVKGNC